MQSTSSSSASDLIAIILFSSSLNFNLIFLFKHKWFHLLSGNLFNLTSCTVVLTTCFLSLPCFHHLYYRPEKSSLVRTIFPYDYCYNSFFSLRQQQISSKMIACPHCHSICILSNKPACVDLSSSSNIFSLRERWSFFSKVECFFQNERESSFSRILKWFLCLLFFPLK